MRVRGGDLTAKSSVGGLIEHLCSGVGTFKFIDGETGTKKILGNKIITVLSCPISLAIGFLFYSTLLILIYTKIRLHLATVCPSGPCIELPD